MSASLHMLLSSPLIDQVLGFQVDVPGRRVVLSESATLLADLTAQLHEGDTVEGVVTGLRDYGAFVSIRSADGELHGTQVAAFQLHFHFLSLVHLHFSMSNPSQSSFFQSSLLALPSHGIRQTQNTYVFCIQSAISTLHPGSQIRHRPLAGHVTALGLQNVSAFCFLGASACLTQPVNPLLLICLWGFPQHS